MVQSQSDVDDVQLGYGILHLGLDLATFVASLWWPPKQVNETEKGNEWRGYDATGEQHKKRRQITPLLISPMWLGVLTHGKGARPECFGLCP